MVNKYFLMEKHIYHLIVMGIMVVFGKCQKN